MHKLRSTGGVGIRPITRAIINIILTPHEAAELPTLCAALNICLFRTKLNVTAWNSQTESVSNIATVLRVVCTYVVV